MERLLKVAAVAEVDKSETAVEVTCAVFICGVGLTGHLNTANFVGLEGDEQIVAMDGKVI